VCVCVCVHICHRGGGEEDDFLKRCTYVHTHTSHMSQPGGEEEDEDFLKRYASAEEEQEPEVCACVRMCVHALVCACACACVCVCDWMCAPSSVTIYAVCVL
jgi:hypothetical protein